MNCHTQGTFHRKHVGCDPAMRLDSMSMSMGLLLLVLLLPSGGRQSCAPQFTATGCCGQTTQIGMQNGAAGLGQLGIVAGATALGFKSKAIELAGTTQKRYPVCVASCPHPQVAVFNCVGTSCLTPNCHTHIHTDIRTGQGRAEEARALFTHHTEMFPDDAGGWSNLGVSKMRQGFEVSANGDAGKLSLTRNTLSSLSSASYSLLVTLGRVLLFIS